MSDMMKCTLLHQLHSHNRVAWHTQIWEAPDCWFKDTENIKLVFCAVKDTIMQTALKEFNLAWAIVQCFSFFDLEEIII